MSTYWIKTILSFFIYGLLLLAEVKAFANTKTWTYEIKSIETNSSHPKSMDFQFHIDRVSRGVYAISGKVMIDVDIVDGDDFEIMASSYRSNSGVNEYKALPFTLPRQHLYTFMDKGYKDMLMETLSGCSDLPVFEDKFVRPLERKTYTLDKCQFNQDGFPNYLQEGGYKILVFGFGPVAWCWIVIVEIEKM